MVVTSLVLMGLASPARALTTEYRDFDGDGREDLLCENIDSGHIWIDYANFFGQFYGTDWQGDDGFCNDGTLHFGDFNGDGLTDLLCHTSSSIKLDFAEAGGVFRGADWIRTSNWCSGLNLYIGDFNGDGHDDLLCHNPARGYLWIDYADHNVRFQGTDWQRIDLLGFCRGWGLAVGDYNGDGRDDIMCADTVSGDIWVNLWTPAAAFGGTIWHGTEGCRELPETESIYDPVIGDFNGDGRDDLMCRQRFYSSQPDLLIDYANSAGQFLGPNVVQDTDGWCTSGLWDQHHVVRFGDYNGDGLDDILCHYFDPSFPAGWYQITYTQRGGGPFDVVWSRDSTWCTGDRQRLF
jgi:hypothetical protein